MQERIARPSNWIAAGSRLGQFRRRLRPILCFNRGLQSGQTISNPTIRSAASESRQNTGSDD
jgi:hypothetical protein